MYRKWGLNDIKEVIKEISIKMGKDATYIPIRISKRMTSTKGTYSFRTIRKNIRPIGFAFSDCLLNGDYEEEVVREVIIHEYIHFYVNALYNRNCHHDGNFKRYCRKAGISDETYFKHEALKSNNNSTDDSTANIKKARKNTNYKYKVTCTSCNRSFYRHRFNKGISHFKDNYACAYCYGKLEVEML